MPFLLLVYFTNRVLDESIDGHKKSKPDSAINEQPNAFDSKHEFD